MMPGSMPLEEAIRLRRSVRGFLPDEVPAPILHEVFTLAQQTPSNCNVQPWIPHVVSGTALAALREALVTVGAPHAVFIFMQKPFDTREATDIGMYAQMLMLLLTARGIASCAQGALGLYPPIVRRHLGILDDQRLLFGISFGYEDPTVKANEARVGRASLGEAVHFHR